jgi:hypothetical protein
VVVIILAAARMSQRAGAGIGAAPAASAVSA